MADLGADSRRSEVEPELVGYLDRWSVQPGDRLAVHVSTDAPHYAVDLVRLRSGDPRPGGPGLRETVVAERAGLLDGVHHDLHPGTAVVAPLDLSGSNQSAVAVWVRASRPTAECRQGILSTLGGEGSHGVALAVTTSGCLALAIGAIQETVLTGPLSTAQWQFVYVEWDLTWQRWRSVVADPSRPAQWAREEGNLPADFSPTPTGLVVLGALHPEPSAAGHFSGSIEAPTVFARPLDDPELERLLAMGDPLAAVPDTIVSSWCFRPRRPYRADVPDRGPRAAHGTARNLPAAGRPGHRWTAEAGSPDDAPECYAAGRFHADALIDAAWPVAFEMAVPDGVRSGVYAVRLRASTTDRIPFFVRRAPDTPPAQVLLLLPTMTYLAYANEELPAPGNHLGHLADRARPGPGDRWRSRVQVGASLYDRHADGSGVFFSSRLRPIPNMRPDYLHWVSGEPRHLGADLYIVDFLEHLGQDYDVLTDEDLHEQGAAALAPYRVVLTGSHPEYVTERMLDALDGHVGGGGNLMYLGGNGFYWVTSVSAGAPGVIEVQRGPRGYPWRSEPGERWSVLTGELGGYWRRRGRPAARLVGTSFVAMGLEDPAPGYHRRAPSHDPRHAWAFDGVESAHFGTYGLLMGGAAGHEIDIADPRMGMPPETVVLASSAGHAPTLKIASEIADSWELVDGIVPRADLTLLQRDGAGSVLSVSSICWSGSLSHRGYDNDVARITANVLRGFLAGEPWRATGDAQP
jgi:N,N-dimethylformamidase